MIHTSYKSKIQYKLDFEELVAKVSSDFVAFKDISGSIGDALGIIGQFTGASRAYVFEFDPNTRNMSNTFEWCGEGIEPEIDHLKELPISMFPWWVDQLTQNKVISIDDVSRMAPEAQAEKEILEVQGIKSVLVLPLFVRNELYGFIGFDDVEETGLWPMEDLTLLKITAEIFSNAFERLFAENELKQTNEELSKALEQLKIAQSQIIQQEQMVAIGQLAAGVAHEINNPLGYIISNSAVLRSDGKVILEYVQYFKRLKVALDEGCDIEQVQAIREEIRNFEEDNDIDNVIEDIIDLLDDVDNGLDRVAKIVKGLRIFSRIDSVDEKGLYDINEAVTNTLMVAGNELKYVTEIHIDLGQVPQIICVGSQINQVLLNVVLNASYAIRECERADKGNIWVKTYSDGFYIYCEIRDDGVGISEENQSKIFNAFFTTKPVGEGTGLGLSIAYDIIVNKHGGQIAIESQLRSGTNVKIALPIEDDKLQF